MVYNIVSDILLHYCLQTLISTRKPDSLAVCVSLPAGWPSAGINLALPFHLSEVVV